MQLWGPRLSLLLLLVLAGVLLMPVLGLGKAPSWVIVVLLLVRFISRLLTSILSGQWRSVILEGVVTLLVAFLLLNPKFLS
ncbi:MAG: hypothetical protein U0Z75_06440 [Deinococcaceae bacterium]